MDERRSNAFCLVSVSELRRVVLRDIDAKLISRVPRIW